MTKESFIVNGIRYIRVTKKRAKREFNAGSQIYLLSVEMNPINSWMLFHGYNNQDSAFSNRSSTFEEIVIRYEYYNCNNSYAKYFITENNNVK